MAQTQIAVSEDGNECLELILKETNLFKDEQSIGKFAAFYAIKEELGDNLIFKSKKTKWGIGSFDSNGSITKIIGEFFPEDADKSVEKLEYLINAGLSKMNKEMKINNNWLNKEIELMTDSIIHSSD